MSAPVIIIVPPMGDRHLSPGEAWVVWGLLALVVLVVLWLAVSGLVDWLRRRRR